MLYVDVETTGLDCLRDEILSLAVVDDAGTVLLNRHFSPVWATAWPAAQAVHGISPDFLKETGAKPFVGSRGEIRRLLEGQVLCAYNVAFDSGFLYSHGVEVRPQNLRCCMRRFAIRYGEPSTKPYHADGHKYLKLDYAAEILNLGGFEKHTALADAQMCRQIWQKMDASFHK